jgi:hypothetical protein
VKDIEALCFDSSRDPTTFFGCCWIIILKRRKRHKMLSLDRALSSYLLPSTTSSFFCFFFQGDPCHCFDFCRQINFKFWFLKNPTGLGNVVAEQTWMGRVERDGI